MMTLLNRCITNASKTQWVLTILLLLISVTTVALFSDNIQHVPAALVVILYILTCATMMHYFYAPEKISTMLAAVSLIAAIASIFLLVYIKQG